MRNLLKTIVAKLTPPKVTGNAAVMENMEMRQMLAATPYELGVCINNNDLAMNAKAIPQLKALGVNAVRVWISNSRFTSRWVHPAFAVAKLYKDAGFRVIAEVTAPGGNITVPTEVKGWFQWALSNPVFKSSIDAWEIGNETEYAEYWKGTPKQYVDLFLKPASEVLRPAGEAVISAGPSWDSQRVKQFIDYGILNMVDAIGYHPYANSVSLMKQRIKEIKAVVNGRKPIVASEWSVRGYSANTIVNGVKNWYATNITSWANATKEIFPSIKANFADNYYFGVFKTNKTMAGPGGLLNEGSATPTELYNALKAVRNAPDNLIGGPTVIYKGTAKTTTTARTNTTTFSSTAIKLIDAPSATTVL